MSRQNRLRNQSLLCFIPFICLSHSPVLHLLLSDPLYLFILPSSWLLPPVKKFPSPLLRFLFPLYLYFLTYFPLLFVFTYYCHSSLQFLAIFSRTTTIREYSSPFPRILSTPHWGFPERVWKYYLHVHVLILLLLMKIFRFLPDLFCLLFILLIFRGDSYICRIFSGLS